MVLLFITLFWAVWSDIRSLRIPNRIILTGYGGGVVYHIVRQIWQSGELLIFKSDHIVEICEYVLAAFALLLLLIPLFKFRVIGGGDVKLFSVCGIYTGFQGGIIIILYALFIGAVISVFSLAYRRFFSKVSEVHTIHFSIPVLLGTVTYCLYGGWIWLVF